MPFFCVSQCQGNTNKNYYNYINSTMKYEIIISTIYNLIFVLCLWLLRKVHSTFSAVNEICWVVVIFAFAYAFQSACLLFLSDTLFVVMGYYEYVILVASMVCLYLTALDPIAETYETSSIIPFSLN
jgi:hypothetical protein